MTDQSSDESGYTSKQSEPELASSHEEENYDSADDYLSDDESDIDPEHDSANNEWEVDDQTAAERENSPTVVVDPSAVNDSPAEDNRENVLRLMDLPRELRDIVYDYAVPAGQTFLLPLGYTAEYRAECEQDLYRTSIPKIQKLCLLGIT